MTINKTIFINRDLFVYRDDDGLAYIGKAIIKEFERVYYKKNLQLQ